MKIKRSAWHYKVSNWLGFEKHGDNLCLYFWRLVFKCVMATFCVLGTAFIGYVWFNDPLWVFNSIIFITVIASVFLPMATIWYTRSKFGSPEIPGSNILVEYIKAKKARICPLIEYVD